MRIEKSGFATREQKGVPVNAARSRYDGAKRNPWNETEPGHHCARAMPNWSLLTAFSGFHYSAPARAPAFYPRQGPGAGRLPGDGAGALRVSDTVLRPL